MLTYQKSQVSEPSIQTLRSPAQQWVDAHMGDKIPDRMLQTIASLLPKVYRENIVTFLRIKDDPMALHKELMQMRDYLNVILEKDKEHGIRLPECSTPPESQ